MKIIELYEDLHRSESMELPNRAITTAELRALERRLDELYTSLGLDLEFSDHFMDRINDPRNKKQITVSELYKLFIEELKVHGKKIAQAGPDFEAVFMDISTDLNVPFILRWNYTKNELEVIAKTIMRKNPFMTSSPKLIVGLTSKKK